MAAQLSPENYFHAYDGSVLKGIDDLKRFLERVDEDVFRRHVDGTKNDFYNWVRDCIREDIGEAIKDSKTQDSMLSVIHGAETENSGHAGPYDDVSGDTHDDSGDFFSGSSVLSAPASHAEASEGKASSHSDNTAKMKDDTISTLAQGNIKQVSASTETRSSSKKKPGKTVKKNAKSKNKSQTKSKRGVAKTSHKDYKEDFDYSFDLESEREELDRIRERISRLNKEISSSQENSSKRSGVASAFSDEKKGSSKRGSSPGRSGSSKTRRTDVKKRDVSSGKTTKNPKQSQSGTSSSSGQPSSRSSKKESKRNKKEEKDIALSFIQQPKKSKRGSLQKSAKDSRKHNLKVVDEKNLEHEMKNFYGQSINETKEDKKRNPFFKKLMGKFTRTEKIVKQELPNLHEMERGKKAEETFNPYIQIDHPWNYHNHGLPDFIKGLLIGMLIGMLFLALFL
ncbi:MAG: hypothetical protein ACLFTR_00510 [Candidatus Woesearchaeota archaeon]